MKTLRPHTLLAHALHPGDKLLLAPNQIHRRDRNEKLTEALHRRGLRFGLSPVPHIVAFQQRLHWVSSLLTFKGFDLGGVLDALLLGEWRAGRAPGVETNPPTNTDIVAAVRIALTAVGAPSEQIETLLRKVQEAQEVYQHALPTLILRVFGAAPAPHPSTLPLILGEVDEWGKPRRMSAQEITVTDEYRGIYLPAGSSAYSKLEASVVAEAADGPPNCKLVWNADTALPARLPLHEGVTAHPYPAPRRPSSDPAHIADIAAKAQDYADALRARYTKGDVLIQHEPGDLCVTIWRVDRIGAGAWTPSRRPGSRRAAPYRSLAEAMQPGDSVLFPPDYGINRIRVGLLKAMRGVHDDVTFTRAYHDGSVRIWRAPASNDADPPTPRSEPVIVTVHGYDVKIESGIPIPGRGAHFNEAPPSQSWSSYTNMPAQLPALMPVPLNG